MFSLTKNVQFGKYVYLILSLHNSLRESILDRVRGHEESVNWSQLPKTCNSREMYGMGSRPNTITNQIPVLGDFHINNLIWFTGSSR